MVDLGHELAGVQNFSHTGESLKISEKNSNHLKTPGFGIAFCFELFGSFLREDVQEEVVRFLLFILYDHIFLFQLIPGFPDIAITMQEKK